MAETAARGRPRSETARRAVLEAALQLCQRDGYQSLTIKGIAEAAGVGRQTVYRWWATKDAVLLEAVRDLVHRHGARLAPATGDTMEDVRALLTTAFGIAREPTGQALAGLMAQAQHDPDLWARLQGAVIGPHRAALRDALVRGVESGELSDGEVPLDLAVDLVFGTLWYRLASRQAPMGDDLAEQLTRALRSLLSPRARGGSADGGRPRAGGSHGPRLHDIDDVTGH